MHGIAVGVIMRVYPQLHVGLQWPCLVTGSNRTYGPCSLASDAAVSHAKGRTENIVVPAVAVSVQIEGAENLPRPDEAAVYVANHQSFMVSTSAMACRLCMRQHVVSCYDSICGDHCAVIASIQASFIVSMSAMPCNPS